MFNIKRLVLLFVFVIMTFSVLAIEDNLTIVGDDPTAIQDFLHIYFRDMSSPDTETTIYIGQLPSELNINLPMDDVTIVGAIEREGPFSNTELIMTSSKTVDELSAKFEMALADTGWEKLGVGYQARGFVAQDQSYLDFCNIDLDKATNISLRETDNETVIRMYVNDADPYMCNQQDMSESYQNDPYMRLPELATPEGVTMLINRGGGGGGFPGNMYSSTSTWLTSDVLTLEELMSAYNEQLVENSWEQLSFEAGEHHGLSLWTFSNEDSQWSGYFSLMESATEDGQYYATIMVEQVPE